MKFLWTILVFATATPLFGGDLDTIGVTLLRTVDPALKGNGVPVIHAEPPEALGTPPPFEVNPSNVGQPASLFTWTSILGTSTTFPNLVGASSSHANAVALNFYGTANGVAPQVAHVYNYEAEWFYDNRVSTGQSLPARVVSQSFTFAAQDETSANADYDAHSAAHGTLFITGIGNGGPVAPSGTSYNSIGVGVNPGTSSAGPTSDGRCKPDISSPGGFATSFATPLVAGSAAVLIQAGMRGDGGSDTNAATDLRTVKALLLNGAVKQAGWTNSSTRPLDLRYGAGLLNTFNAWQQLKGGKRAFIESNTVGNDAPHPPGGSTSNVAVLTGWDRNTISTVPSQDRVNHYYFNLAGTNTYTLTATLVWLRNQGESTINNLNLYLYRVSDSNLVAACTSAVDNVEHLALPQLAPGRYDLQVLKRGQGQVSSSETYALAFEAFNLGLTITRSNANMIVSWPIAPAGFRLRYTTNLNPPVAWSDVTNTVVVNTNTARNSVTLPAAAARNFFRLQRP